jgi:hypothetical protein
MGAPSRAAVPLQRTPPARSDIVHPTFLQHLVFPSPHWPRRRHPENGSLSLRPRLVQLRCLIPESAEVSEVVGTFASMTGTDEHGYPEPPAVGDEVATLLGSLERQRATFAWKCADLDAASLRATFASSALTLGGLLKHLAYMEDINFARDLAGHDLPAPWCDADWEADGDWEFNSARDDSPADLYALWADAVGRSRAAVDAVLDEGGMEQVTTTGAKPHTVRRLIVDMIEEYGRHTGHADLIREAIDGRVGEDPPGRPYPYQRS